MRKKEKKEPRVRYELTRPVVAIGNPGTGKSVIFERLARKLDKFAIDGDKCIECDHGGIPLEKIVKKKGCVEFIRLEGMVVRRIFDEHEEPELYTHGGSLVRSRKTVKYLKKAGAVFVYLEDDFDRILKSIKRRPKRGIAVPEGKTREQELRDRIPIFEQDADITIHVNGDRRRAMKELFRVLLEKGIVRRV
jgi:shikimate kinase